MGEGDFATSTWPYHRAPERDEWDDLLDRWRPPPTTHVNGLQHLTRLFDVLTQVVWRLRQWKRRAELAENQSHHLAAEVTDLESDLGVWVERARLAEEALGTRNTELAALRIRLERADRRVDDLQEKVDRHESHSPQLTPEESEALDTLSLFSRQLGKIVVGPQRDSDMGELVAKIHDLQAAVMSNVCARAHPDYRLLGGSNRA